MTRPETAKKPTNTTSQAPTQKMLVQAPIDNAMVPVNPSPETSATTSIAQVKQILGDTFFTLAGKISAITEAHEEVVRQNHHPAVCALARARAVAELRKVLDENIMAEYVMPLMNCEVGFLTDRPNKYEPNPYAALEVRECVVSALLQGLRIDGNEWNIIKGKCFVVVNGWRRRFSEINGISDIRLVPGKPRWHEGNWIVVVRASWQIDGVPDQLTDNDGKPGQAFLVEGKQDAQVSNIIGKAIGDSYKAAYWKAVLSRNTLGQSMVRTDLPVQTLTVSDAEKAALTDGQRAVSTAQAVLAQLQQKKQEQQQGSGQPAAQTMAAAQTGTQASQAQQTSTHDADLAECGAICKRLVIDDDEQNAMLKKLNLGMGWELNREKVMLMLNHLRELEEAEKKQAEEERKAGM